ncbi:DM13 domain-containing protein [filamentous cyanobacterium LEGE 11480]|uniref:DM13 domain-containing protein n=1 Tax=Romeriopsis navalis LEGE 11480 TaxID=2777977 RepID=A0A928VKC3_9CYAN|nr:DM13 domain-containing protein [Romeriopsis navalis]MBE9030171.1 DM13 domain-containing protein [Romeriopsis navalis LEGE 11480]
MSCAADQATPPPPPKLNGKASNTSTPADAASPKTASPIVRSGKFVDAEHPTKGTAKLVTKNNQHSLEFDQAFSASTSGPDLVVVLHRSADVVGETTPPAFPIKEGDYIEVAKLKSYSGKQSYTIPANIDVDDYKSVAIWCRKFNATFGAATLKP